MMFGLDASKKKKLSKIVRDKNAATATFSSKFPSAISTSALQRSASTRVKSTTKSSTGSSATGWQSSAPLGRGKVFEWIDDEGRSTSPPPPFARNQVKEVLVDLDRGSGLGITLRGGSDHSLGIYVSSVDADSSADYAGFRVGDQILSLNGDHWVKYVDDEEGGRDCLIEPTMRLEAGVQSILRWTQSSRTLCFRIRSTAKVPSASVIRSSASLNTRSSTSRVDDTDSAGSGTRAGAAISGRQEEQAETRAACFTESTSAAFVRKKSLIPFSRCSFRSDSRPSSSSSSSSRQQQPHQQQQQSVPQTLSVQQSGDRNERRMSNMEITPMPSPISPTFLHSSRRPSSAHAYPTPFEIELRRILTESETGTFHYFKNEYLMGRLPVASLVNFLKQFLDRIDHRHALIRLVHEQVIRTDEKDLFRRLVSSSFSLTHIPSGSAGNAAATQYDPSSSLHHVTARAGLQQQNAATTGSIHAISSDEEDVNNIVMMDGDGSNSGSKRRLSTTSVTSMANSSVNGSSANLNVIAKNRRCSSLHLSNPGKRMLPGIPITSSDLNLNPGSAGNPRRASIMSTVSAGGHHLLPIPPPMQQQSLGLPSASSLAVKRHSTSRIESASLSVPMLDESQRRHSSSTVVLGNSQTSNVMHSSNNNNMMWDQVAGGNMLEPENKKYFSASATCMNATTASNSGSVASGVRNNTTERNQLFVPSVNVRRSSVDVDRTSSGDEVDPESDSRQLALPIVSQVRRGSGNHLMIPGEEDAAPSLYLLLPQVDSQNNRRRGSNFNQDPNNQFTGTTIPFPACHIRVRRHRSLPSPFISGASSGLPSVSPPLVNMGRRPSAVQQAPANTQMVIGKAGTRITDMQYSGPTVGSETGVGRKGSSSAGETTAATLIQGYSNQQSHDQQQPHRRSSSFRRPLHRSTIEPGGRVRVHVKKCKPFLGIAIEGGSDVRTQPLPRIISILGNGAAFESGDLHVGHIILEVDCISMEGLRHEQVAQMIADAYYKTPHKDYIELLVREKKKAEFDVRHSSIILLNSTFE